MGHISTTVIIDKEIREKLAAKILSIMNRDESRSREPDVIRKVYAHVMIPFASPKPDLFVPSLDSIEESIR